MRQIFLALLLAAGAAAQTAGPSAPPQTSASAVPETENARKARTLVNQAIEALGGPAYLNVKDMQQEGRTYRFYRGQPSGTGAPYWRFWKFPDKDRVELTKQRDVIYVYKGNQGFETTFRGTRLMQPDETEEYLRNRQYSLENVLRNWLAEPGVALFYDGPALAEQRQAVQVSVLSSRNEGVTLYLDPNTHLPLKKVFYWRDPKTRDRNEEAEVYDNYRRIQGIATPHSVSRSRNGELVSQRFITTVAYNTSLADSLFESKVTYETKAQPKQ
jgi:hypothetical protein